MITKNFLIAATTFLFLFAGVQAQDAPDNRELLKKATFSIETDDAVLNFVLLNNKTVDALFSGPSKYSIRARANASTVFFVKGKAKKDCYFEPSFEVVQNGMFIKTKTHNIKNFKKDSVAKDADIQGLLELKQKLNLYQPFKIKDTVNTYAEFQYDWDALENMKN